MNTKCPNCKAELVVTVQTHARVTLGRIPEAKDYAAEVAPEAIRTALVALGGRATTRELTRKLRTQASAIEAQLLAMANAGEADSEWKGRRNVWRLTGKIAP